MRKYLILFTVLLLISSIIAEETTGDGEIDNLEIPYTENPEEIVCHTGYYLKYNEEFEQAEWVAYHLTKEEVEGTFSRKGNQREDPAIITGSASSEDYKGFGFDRGHLAPAADFKWSEQAMDDTFFMSNMSPQRPRFNQHIWRNLEEQVRVWAREYNEVYIITGPVLTDGPYETIGDNNVAIPKRFYKVILDYKEPEIKGIAFIIPNLGTDESFMYYACSIDHVEEATGIDFSIFYRMI